MTGESKQNPEPLAKMTLSSSEVAPSQADVTRMYQLMREFPGREIEWIWTESGRTFKIVGSYPIIKDRDFWDYELRDDPVWILAEELKNGSSAEFWQYKTSDQTLVFEITKMPKKQNVMGDASVEDNQPLAASPETQLVSPVSGLFTYSAFLVHLEREYIWYRRYGTPLSLIVFDIKTKTTGLKDRSQWLTSDGASQIRRRIMKRPCDVMARLRNV